MSAFKLEENLFPDYSLNFIEIGTNKTFRGKRLSNGDYGILIDPVLGQKEFLTQFKFRKRFKSAVSNRRFFDSSARKCKTIFDYQ
jgi:hypothetical protein